MDNLGELLVAVLAIVVIDLTLSGDNAIVIGMAAHRLPPRQRRVAIIFGAGGAIALRVTFTAMAAYLLLIPLLRALGGLILVWIARKLLHQEVQEDGGETKVASSLFEAIKIIVLADIIMSLDNILAVGGASRGNLELLLFGLLLSMTIVMTGSGILAALMNRMGWLVYVGAGVLVWTAAGMIADDPYVGPYLPPRELSVLALTLLFGVIVTVLTIRERQRLAAVPSVVEPMKPVPVRDRNLANSTMSEEQCGGQIRST